MDERQEGLGLDEPILDRARMSRMVREYYRIHGWNERSGVPTRETVEELDLGEFAAYREGRCSTATG